MGFCLFVPGFLFLFFYQYVFKLFILLLRNHCFKSSLQKKEERSQTCGVRPPDLDSYVFEKFWRNKGQSLRWADEQGIVSYQYVQKTDHHGKNVLTILILERSVMKSLIQVPGIYRICCKTGEFAGPLIQHRRHIMMSLFALSHGESWAISRPKGSEGVE